ncbi:MAG: 1,4-alpha-glucan branching enzyme, partial [Burkholderiales bacterium]|nr:1,4-alpha-glucan branching enzyme [Burkholderiales bacterium]
MTDSHLQALLAARFHDPLSVLGIHTDGGIVVRHLDPSAERAWVMAGSAMLPMVQCGDGIFEWRGDATPPTPLRIRVARPGGLVTVVSPWAFGVQIPESDVHLFNEGKLLQAWRTLGAHAQTRDGVAGVRFACWAPNAERVSVVGDFNAWDGRCHPMQSRGGSGLWELFVPELPAGALYKFEIRNRATGDVVVKTDPYGQQFERRPGTAARVTPVSAFAWTDNDWLQARARRDWLHAPLNTYEVHMGSWMRHPDGRFHTYRELAERLIPYAVDLGYTHLELLPVSEHPLDESWGYQTTGYFAPTSRFGDPDDLRAFVDACHQAGLGVILDWVPGHFPQDAWALARFDGTALYEHEDPRLGLHKDWGTHIFNYGRNEVKS